MMLGGIIAQICLLLHPYVCHAPSDLLCAVQMSDSQQIK